MKMPEEKPEVRIKPRSYRPSKNELAEEIKIDASPEDVIRAAFRQARVADDANA